MKDAKYYERCRCHQAPRESLKAATKAVFSALLLCCVATTASAQHLRSYVGLGVGATQYPDATQWVENEIAARVTAASGVTTTASATQKQDGTGAKLFAGYWFSENAAVELSYVDLGETKLTVATTPVVTASTYTVEGIAYSISLLLSQNVVEKLNIFGRMGLYRAETEITSRRSSATDVVTERDSASNTGTLVALGATYDMSNAMSLRIEWENLFRVGDDIKTARGDVSLSSVSFLHRF